MRKRSHDLLALAIVTSALCYVFSVLMFSVSEFSFPRRERFTSPASPVVPQRAPGVVVLPTE